MTKNFTVYFQLWKEVHDKMDVFDPQTHFKLMDLCK